MNGDQAHPWINSEIEARIVALVLGEASDFEREELERILSENEELTLFKNRIEVVHELLKEASTEAGVAGDDWKLPAEKRAALLKAIEHEEPQDRDTSVKLAPQEPARRHGRLKIRWSRISGVAAAICLFAVLGWVWIPFLNVFESGTARRSDVPVLAYEMPPMSPDVASDYELGDRGRDEAPPELGALSGAGGTPAPDSTFASAGSIEGERQVAVGLDQRTSVPALGAVGAADAAFENGAMTDFGGRIDPDDDLQMPQVAADGLKPVDVAGLALPARRYTGGEGLEYQQERARRGNIPLPASGGSVIQGTKGAEIARRAIAAGKAEAPETQLDPSAGLDEKEASREPFSTFSLHVSDVSFKLAQSALANGEWPEADRIRIEEFVNAFDYGDPTPSREAKVGCRLEQAAHPLLQRRNLLRVSMRTAAAGRADDTPLRLTFLLDNSGSMERFDRRETVRRAFALLATQLRPIDQVTLITFARQPRLVADRVSGEHGDQLADIVFRLPREGGTNIEAALRLAFEKAREQQMENAQNRIVLLTDGAANLGDADPESLARTIESMRHAGIAFDAAGIGADGLNDEILEALTRKGDGRYYLLDRPEDADAGFARQIAGALRPAAGNVKVQVELNPARVGQYKLLGFEKHRLAKEDFRDDNVDAAELAAEEAGVALYQLESRADGQGDVGSVSVRFHDLSSGRMVEKRWPIPYEPNAPRLEEAAPSQRLAAVAALFAARLKGDALGQIVDLGELARLLSGLPQHYRGMERVRQLREMVDQARQIDPAAGG